MAVDEALLEAACADRTSYVRLYEWDRATVSLGYFQRLHLERSDSEWPNPEFRSLPMVRRLSGGGAILHEHEWTYSCAVPAGHPLAREPGELYDRVHEQLIAVLSRHGLAARMRNIAEQHRDGNFLCFGRGDPRDVLLHEHKILGSAQRRRRGAILQHGSLLMARSSYAPEYPGVFDLAPKIVLDRSFPRELVMAIGELFGRPEEPGCLSEPIHAAAKVLQKSRYDVLDWPRRSNEVK
jgi:lipoate-protein ligase A